MHFPSELLAYFDKIQSPVYRNRFDVEVHLLNPEEVVTVTDLLAYHPLVESLEGIVLDDPDTSNHHVYLRRPPFVGHILYLAHADDKRIMFPSLDDFLTAVDRGLKQGESLYNLHPVCSPLIADQAALCAFIEEDIFRDGDNELALACIPSLDLNNLSLLTKLATSDDFYLGEAVAMEICKRPTEHLRVIAELCCQHRHPQVTDVGHRALLAIQGRQFVK
ncbi:hypothetical protein ACO0LF_27020 [Undibacterium sp. Di27W]|uniref:hypothetical protein n=1 Tax=Undibacterium sp. Di27W TaxID=3413036 RepID=UPI003BF26E80